MWKNLPYLITGEQKSLAMSNPMQNFCVFIYIQHMIDQQNLMYYHSKVVQLVSSFITSFGEKIYIQKDDDVIPTSQKLEVLTFIPLGNFLTRYHCSLSLRRMGELMIMD